MAEKYERKEYLEKTRKTRRDLDMLIDELLLGDQKQAVIAGDWNLQDIIAHISWHEKEMIGAVQAHALVGSELWDLPLDRRNRAIYELNKNRSWDEVIEEYRNTFPKLSALLEMLSNDDLNSPAGWKNMPPDWQPGAVIASNTYEHYEDHIKDLQDYLKGKK